MISPVEGLTRVWLAFDSPIQRPTSLHICLSDRTYPELCADTARIDLNKKCYSEIKSSLTHCFSSIPFPTSWRSLGSCGGAHVAKYTFDGLHRLISLLFYNSFLFWIQLSFTTACDSGFQSWRQYVFLVLDLILVLSVLGSSIVLQILGFRNRF